MSRTIIIPSPRVVARIYIASAMMALMLMTNIHPLAQDKTRTIVVKPGRSVVRSQHGMVASSQPLASEVGLEVLKRGGNAVDAAIAMAAMLNVTEPMMTGVGGDAFMLVYWSKTKELKGLNASGRAPKALTLDYFAKRKITKMPEFGMESITVPGAFDGWVTLLEKYGTMKLADLLAPAIDCAENGFPVMEKTAEDWNAEVAKLKKSPAAAANYLIDGRAPKAGEIFRQPNLARTLRTLARGGRDAFYKGEIARAIVDYCEKNGGFISLADLAAQKSEWVEPISTNYRGYTVYEIPPNGQGLTALLTLNILECFDLAALSAQPDRYYHTLIEATKLAFADRNRYIADPAFSKVPVVELLSKDYAAAATRPTSRSSTKTATPCRSSIVCSTLLDQGLSPAIRGSYFRIEAVRFHSIDPTLTILSRASVRFTRLFRRWSSEITNCSCRLA